MSKEHTLSELVSQVKETLNKKIEDYSKEIKELKEREFFKSEELAKKTPPGFSETTMYELKDKYGTEGAFKVAWAAYKKLKKSEMSKTAPPGREDQVKRLKKIPGIKNPYAVAWASYNKSAKKNAGMNLITVPHGEQDSSYGSAKLMLSEKKSKKNMALGYGMGSQSVGTSIAPVMRSKKSEDYINRETANEHTTDPYKGKSPRYKNIGDAGKTPGKEKIKEKKAPGSGGLQKEEKQPSWPNPKKQRAPKKSPMLKYKKNRLSKNKDLKPKSTTK